MSALLPDVSVVVISYNDAARVGRAIASVQRQTLRNLEIIVVDDASTDDTAAIVAALAAADSRIRYVRLDANSGGCSAPRNRGLAEARAPWVMFCDSDDEYERHACKNLLLAAEQHDADVVCGKAVRVDASSGKRKDWRPELHEELTVAEGLQAFPDLLYDTISVNKIYRRALLEHHALRFPEGLLFEDQLFTLQAMALAARIVSIPEVVYYWYVDRLSEDLSITQRRAEMRNVDSRMQVNRLIDEFLAARGLDGLLRVKDVKFLRHDLHLYLVSILDSDDDTARMLMDRLVPYVREVDLRAAWEIRPMSRIAIYHLLLGDLEHVRAAMRFLRWASVVDCGVLEVDGRQLWACGHDADGPDVAGIPAREWLDITDLNLLAVPFADRRYAHVLEASADTAQGFSLRGSTVDYAGDLDSSVRLEVQARTASGSVVAHAAAEWADAAWPAEAGARHAWRTTGPWQTRMGRGLKASDRGTLALVLVRDGVDNVTTLRARVAGLAATSFGYPGTAEPGRPVALVLEQQEYAAVGWRASADLAPPASVAARGLAAARRRAVAPIAGRLARGRADGTLVLAECNGGRRPEGRIAAVAAALQAEDPGVRIAWIDRDGSTQSVAEQAMLMRGSAAYERALLGCAAYLTDGLADVPSEVSAPVVMVGTAPRVVREGRDDPAVLVDAARRKAVRARARRWSLALAAGPADAEALASAWAFDRPIEACGTPEVPATEASLGLPTERPVVVYAPALRDPGVVPQFDVDEWARALGRDCFLVIAPAPGSGLDVPTRLRSAVRLDTSRTPAYVSAATLVIGDYGPSVPWRAALNLPAVGYLPDWADFVERRHGLYFDVRSLAPQATRMADLIELVGQWLATGSPGDHEPGAAAYSYRAAWCGPDAGAPAAAAGARAILAHLGAGMRP